MAVPNFQAFFRPFLEAIADGREYSLRDLHSLLANALKLTEEDLLEMVRSGQQTKFNNRVSWTRTYFGKAQVIEIPRRGHVRISARGNELLTSTSGEITKSDLNRFPEFANFSRNSGEVEGKSAIHAAGDIAAISPEEQLDALYTDLNAALTDDLLAQVQALTPAQFERLVVQVLVAMGYGGSVRDAGAALGKSGDNGIDGVVKQDPLGLDKIYIQAKQWTNNVGSQEVRNFSGSLTYHKATKGVLLTTADFSASATDTARQIGNIILIGGQQLAGLMIEYGVGVLTRSTYLVRRVDSEFFEEL